MSRPPEFSRFRPILPALWGQIGIGVAAGGTLIAVAWQVADVLRFKAVLSPGLLIGAFLYLMGAFVASLAMGYRRDSKLYIFFMTCRALIFCAMMFGVFTINR